MKGSIEVIAGCMFSGKTEELIRRLRRATIAKKRVAVFKPGIDDRYAVLDIVTHDGTMLRCLPMKSAWDLHTYVASIQPQPEVVGIDEAQFFDDAIVPFAEELAKKGIRVLLAGLDMDAQGEPFGSMPHLLAIADEVTKLHAVCTTCGEPAMFSQRLVAVSGQVLVGGKEAYEARCRLHWSHA